MKALHIYAGPAAKKHIAQHGLKPEHVAAIPAAAGGPKGLILGPLDRFIFGEWLPQSSQPVHLVGASIGAWRMAAACMADPVAALQRLQRDYIAQDYVTEPGKKRPTAAHVSERFGQGLRAFYGNQVASLISHPRYKLHVVTSRGRHMLSAQSAALAKVTTPLGFAGAFASNVAHRRAMSAWLERVVFSSPGVELPFSDADYRTRKVTLSTANFADAVQASCSIPFALEPVHNIAGAPRGTYWDGGLTDYHLHMRWQFGDLHATQKRAPEAMNTLGHGPKSLKNNPAANIVLYPHFQKEVIPGWLDKSLKWRHKPSAALDNVVVLAPNPEWVKTLPRSKLPDRTDFTHFATDLKGRMAAWEAATSAAGQMADEFAAFVSMGEIGDVQDW